jgi:hypothetical protein
LACANTVNCSYFKIISWICTQSCLCKRCLSLGVDYLNPWVCSLIPLNFISSYNGATIVGWWSPLERHRCHSFARNNFC